MYFSTEADGGRKASKPNNSKPLDDLLDLDFGNPVAQPPPPTRTAASSSMDPWGMPATQETKPPQLDPWGGVAGGVVSSANDPWSPVKEPPRASPNLGGPSPVPVNQPSKNFYLHLKLKTNNDLLCNP